MRKFKFIKNALKIILPAPVDKVTQEYVNIVKEGDLPEGLPSTLKPSKHKIIGSNCMGNTHIK